MKSKYIIGTIAAIAFLSLAVFSFNSTKIVYADFQKASEIEETFKISGTWVKNQPAKYIADENKFYFVMQDDSSNIMQVVYNGSKPNNFDIATKVLITGKHQDGKFHATEIMTKCPSKYEAGYEDLNAQKSEDGIKL